MNKDSMTTAWAWVVAIIIYGIIIVTIFVYFGEIVLMLEEMMHG